MQEGYVGNKAHSDNTDVGVEVLVVVERNQYYIRIHRGGDLLAVRMELADHIEGLDDKGVDENDPRRSLDYCYCRRRGSDLEPAYDSRYQQMMTKHDMQRWQSPLLATVPAVVDP